MRSEVLWLGWIVLFISFFWHEVGHILWMKHLGIFKGLKLHWWGAECLVNNEADVQINLVEGMMVYGIGFIFSLVLFPVWCLLGFPAITYLLFQFFGSSGDFYYLTKMIVRKITFNENEGMKN